VPEFHAIQQAMEACPESCELQNAGSDGKRMQGRQGESPGSERCEGAGARKEAAGAQEAGLDMKEQENIHCRPHGVCAVLSYFW
jgi:hypothetical protein